MADPGADHARRVVGYYRSPESRLAYRLLLGGTKHFGYYPEGSGRLSMAAAMRRMEDKLGQTLALPPGSRVLDAGCGEGDVAIRLHTRFGLEVDGVDLLEPNLRRARAKAARLGVAGSVRFHRLDYTDLPFPDRSFDVASTMETLVHAFGHGQPAVLRPRRVPGDPRPGRVRGRGRGGRHRADLADAPPAGADLRPAGRGRPAAGRPGGPAQLHGPGRGPPAPGGLALQRRARPAAPVAASPGDAG